MQARGLWDWTSDERGMGVFGGAIRSESAASTAAVRSSTAGETAAAAVRLSTAAELHDVETVGAAVAGI